MIGTTSTGRAGRIPRYYRCAQHIQKGPTACQGVVCRAEDLENAVISHITGFDARTLKKELVAIKEHLAREAAPREKRRARLEADFDQFRERERRLVGLYEEAIIDEALYRERRKALEKERQAVSGELADLELPSRGAACEDIDIDELAERFRALQDTFPHLTRYDQQRLLRATVSTIRLGPDGIADVNLNLVAGIEGAPLQLDDCIEVDLTMGKGRAATTRRVDPHEGIKPGKKTIIGDIRKRDTKYAQAAS